MLEIQTEQNGAEYTVYLSGRLDTNTSPDLEATLRELFDGMDELIFDLEKLDYISSAGLRVLLSAQKVMNDRGGMVVRNVNDDVMDVFEMTGFIDFLSIL